LSAHGAPPSPRHARTSPSGHPRVSRADARGWPPARPAVTGSNLSPHLLLARPTRRRRQRRIGRPRGRRYDERWRRERHLLHGPGGGDGFVTLATLTGVTGVTLADVIYPLPRSCSADPNLNLSGPPGSSWAGLFSSAVTRRHDRLSPLMETALWHGESARAFVIRIDWIADAAPIIFHSASRSRQRA